MKKRMRRACALLLSVVMTLGEPAGNGWAETEVMEQELADAIYEAEELSVASASDAQRNVESNEELEDEEEFDDSVLEEDGEKEYDKDFSKLISDLEFLHVGDLTEITEDKPIAFGEDVIIRFYYKLDEVMLNVLEDGEMVELEYQLSDELLKLTDSYEELSSEDLDSGDDGNLDWQVTYGDGGLLDISIETEQDAVLDEKGYVDVQMTVDGEEITESLWEILVECGEGELRKELFVSAGEEIALASVEGDFEIDENGVLVKYLGDGGDVVIPDGVTEIGDEAFYGLGSNVNSVEIPDSVTSIGKYAFYWCGSLSSVEIPDSVVNIGEAAFSKCWKLQTVNLSKGMTRISDSMFEECYDLVDIDIPANVSSIGKKAFYWCSNLKNIDLPDNLETIEQDAFSYCKTLDNLIIPDNTIYIGNFAFACCEELKNIKLSDRITYLADGIFSGCKNLENIEIPYAVISIGNQTFEDCKLSKIKLPDSLNSIGAQAFRGCSFDKISIPNNVINIGKYAFSHCENLTNILLPSNLEVINEGLFDGCTRLNHIEIPDNVISIEDRAFAYCSNLTDVSLPSNLTQLNYMVFYTCEKLRRIIVPDKVTRIEQWAFAHCPELSEVVIPDSVIDISPGRLDIYMDTGAAFYFSPYTVFYGYSGSYAESYAKEYEIPFVALDGIGKQTGFLARFLTWDPSTQEATFDTSIPYHATEDTDMSFLDSLDTILGSYVWVEDHPTNVGQFLSITPLEERFGTITAANSGFVNIDGESYMMRSGLADLVDMMKEGYLNQYVKYYIAEDIIYDIKVPEQKTGILKAWNASSSEITIADSSTGSETVYPVSLTDLSVIASLDVWIGHEIGYSVLDGVVYRIITKAYETQVLGKVQDYDASAGIVTFENGALYGVSSDAEFAAGSFVGKWTVCTLTTSVDGVTAITGFSPLEAKLKVGLALEPGHDTLSYQDGKYSIDGTNYQKADAIEIPFAVDVRNTLDISEGDFQMYKAELQADEVLSLTTEAFTMELPDGFYMEWTDGRSFEAGKLLKPGDIWIIGGTLKIRSDYVPENGTAEIKVDLTADKASAGSKTKISLVKKDDTNKGDAAEEDVDWTNKSETYKKALSEVQSELDELAEDCIMSMDSTLTQYLSTTQIESVKRVLVLWISMLSDETLTDSYALRKGMDKSLGVTERPSSSELTAEITIHAETKKGEKDILFKISGNVYQFDKVSLGAWGTVGWEIPGEKARGTCPFARLGDIEGFCGKLEKCAEAAVQDAYGKVWGEMVDTVVKSDFIDKLLLDIIKNHCKSVSKGIFSLIWDGIANEIKEPELESLSNSDIRKFIKDAISVLNRLTNDEYSESFELVEKMGENVEKAYERWEGSLTESKRDKTVKIQDLEDMDELYSKLYSHKELDKLQLVHTETGSYASGKALKSGIVPKLEVKILNEGTDYDAAVKYAENSWFKKTPDIVVDISLKDEAGVSLQPNGKLTLRLSLGSGYAGKKVTVYHAIHDEYGIIKKWEDFTRSADEQGKIEFEVSSLSPFVIMTEGNTSFEDTTSPGSGSSATDGNETNGNKTDGNETSGNGGGNISSGSGGGASHSASTVKAVIPSTPGYWMQDEKGWRFMNPDGTAYLDTWVYVNNRWYRLGADGYMLERWAMVNNVWYYLMPESGEMKTGWLFDGQSWYYLDESGAMKTGWIFTNGGWYYLGADGRLLLNTVTPDGYQVDGSGKWIN